MELLFLYIFDFKKIKNQAFAFSSDLNFTVKEDWTEDQPRFNISISKNREYVDMFPDNILNVTGIIGKNGAGKSTLLDCLKLLSGDLSEIISPLIFSVRDNEKGVIYTCYHNRDRKESRNIEWVTVRIDDKSLKKEVRLITSPYWIDVFGNPGVQNLPFDFREINSCFFTNAFHSHSELEYAGIFNLSTNARLDAFMKSLIRERILEDRKKNGGQIETFSNGLSGFHRVELRSMLSFLSYAKDRSTHKIPDLPETLVVNFHFDDYEFLLYDLDSRFRGSTESLGLIYGIAWEQIRDSQDYIDAFNKLLVLCSFFYILRWYFIDDNDKRPLIYNYMENAIADPDSLFDNLLRVIDNFPLRSKHQMNLVRELRTGMTRELRRVSLNAPWHRKDITRFVFQIDNKLWPLLSDIHNITDVENLRFINYEWGGGLSTGQEAFISHFSRLHDIKRQVGSKPIWLFIDEGDLHFHPEMQKEYFSQLLVL